MTTDHRRAPDNDAVLATIAAVASIALTGAAFWLSYEHLHDVASAHGLGHSAVRSWAWPATVDLFIIIGEVLILRASLRRTVDPWAIALTVAGSGGSIALNVAGVGAGAESMDYIVAAVPPIAALLAFGALMRQLHTALAARSESAPVTLPAAPVPQSQSVIEDAPVAPPPPPLERPAVVVESAPAAPSEAPRVDAPERPGPTTQSAPVAKSKAPRKPLPKRPKGVTRADAKAAIEALYDTKQGRPLESEMVGLLKTLPGYPHKSRQHANTIRKEIERERPELAALGSDNVRALTGS